MALHSNILLLAKGDYNKYLDTILDKLSPTITIASAKGYLTSFARLFTEMGWRERNLNRKCFSCYSTMYSGLSHIDMGLGNSSILPMIDSSQYEPRNVYDHSSIWVKISTQHPAIVLISTIRSNSRITYSLFEVQLLYHPSSHNLECSKKCPFKGKNFKKDFKY